MLASYGYGFRNIDPFKNIFAYASEDEHFFEEEQSSPNETNVNRVVDKTVQINECTSNDKGNCEAAGVLNSKRSGLGGPESECDTPDMCWFLLFLHTNVL